jgi:transcription antitermination protein NusB
MNRAPDQSKAPGTSRSARRRARELALQGLYQWLLSSEEIGVIEAHLADTPGFERCDRAHFEGVLGGTIRHVDALRASFSPFLDRPIVELSPVEHATLLIGSYELMHHQEIPYRVIINEAVELAKSFGGTEGFRYVNGVLDKVAGQLRVSEHRTGRVSD